MGWEGESKSTAESLRKWDEQVDTISANGVRLRQIKSTLTHRRKGRKRSSFREQPCHLPLDKLLCVLLAVCFTELEGIHESEKSFLWLSGDTRDCQERHFLREPGRWIWNPENTEPLRRDKGSGFLAGRGGGPWTTRPAGTDSCYPAELRQASPLRARLCTFPSVACSLFPVTWPMAQGESGFCLSYHVNLDKVLIPSMTWLPNLQTDDGRMTSAQVSVI